MVGDLKALQDYNKPWLQHSHWLPQSEWSRQKDLNGPHYLYVKTSLYTLLKQTIKSRHNERYHRL